MGIHFKRENTLSLQLWTVYMQKLLIWKASTLVCFSLISYYICNFIGDKICFTGSWPCLTVGDLSTIETRYDTLCNVFDVIDNISTAYSWHAQGGHKLCICLGVNTKKFESLGRRNCITFLHIFGVAVQLHVLCKDISMLFGALRMFIISKFFWQWSWTWWLRPFISLVFKQT